MALLLIDIVEAELAGDVWLRCADGDAALVLGRVDRDQAGVVQPSQVALAFQPSLRRDSQGLAVRVQGLVIILQGQPDPDPAGRPTTNPKRSASTCTIRAMAHEA